MKKLKDIKIHNYMNKKKRVYKPKNHLQEFIRNPFKKGKALLLGYFFSMVYLIKQSFFTKKSRFSLILLLLLIFVSYSDVNEHFILSIAMFLCLYFSYNTITTLIKSEVKNRNDQIYRDIGEGIEKQLAAIMNKKAYLLELKLLLKDINKINSVYGNRVPHANTHFIHLSFTPTSVVEREAEALLSEQLTYLNSLYDSKKEILETENQSIDHNLEFTDSKLEEIA